MRLAFVSYEFPPVTGGGGIGTYLMQVTSFLAERGHDITVFAGTPGSPTEECLGCGTRVVRVPASSSPDFRAAVVPKFLSEHRCHAFDLVEGTDFDASALEVKRAIPTLPYVVKLHTPRFIVDELNQQSPTHWQRIRMSLGALRRGHWPRSVPVRMRSPALAELEAIRIADEISAPSHAIAKLARSWVRVEEDRLSIVPLPYEPSSELLEIPPGSTSNLITFLGRLEYRKGVIDLADSVPAVLAAVPSASFQFVGRSMPYGPAKRPMAEFLHDRLGRAAAAVEFTGPLPPSAIPHLLAETSILVVPSHWESFGLVCCEGLAAARAVIGGAEGGMAEILDQGRVGLLQAPRDPRSLAQKIIHLLQNPEEQVRLGAAGRQRIQSHYRMSDIGATQLQSYERVIARCRTSYSSAS